MKLNTLTQLFLSHFQKQPEFLAEAPGRVNLIGEHTDYNGGYVLPCAIDRQIRIVGALRTDGIVRAYSIDFDQFTSFSVDRPDHDRIAPWSNYLRGVFHQLLESGFSVPGLDLLIRGTIPSGAGLSSSAALEVATAEIAIIAGGLDLKPLEKALLCQTAESDFVGVQCGIMDQFASVFGERNRALFLNCQSLEYQTVSLPGRTRIVVCDSGVRRNLSQSSYNQRRLECEEALDLLRKYRPDLQNLCQLPASQLQDIEVSMPAVLFRRTRHVVTENQRVVESVKLLTDGDGAGFGRLLYASHESLRDDFEVSCSELDLLVELAARQEGTLGARMTGAGFGGCTVNLVDEEQMEEFSAQMKELYREQTGRRLPVYVCSPWNGVTGRKL